MGHDLALAAKQFYAAHHFGSPSRLAEPNLRSVVSWLEARSYDAYLVGSRTALPIGGPMWNDVYEACRSPHRVHYHGIGRICWLDVAFAFKGHPLAAAIQGVVAQNLFSE